LRKVGKDNNVDIVIYGHSHIPVIDESSQPIIVNPGSISLPRNPDRLKTYLVIEFDNDKIHFIIKHI
jgi:putative phosphoesterase